MGFKMKKIFTIIAILVPMALYSMEEKSTSWQDLPIELRGIIIGETNMPGGLENRLKKLSLVEKEWAGHTQDPSIAANIAKKYIKNFKTAAEMEFIEAAQDGKSKLVRAFIDAGINVNAKDPRQRTALKAATFNNHDEIVKLLIDAGANVNIIYETNTTCLMDAAAAGNEKIVQILLDAGADVDLSGARGLTALMYAALFGYKDIVKLLITAGANINAISNNGKTALSMAESNKHNDVADILKSAGAT